MAYGTVNAEQMTTQSGFTLGAGNASSFKNRIINGNMVIDQRATAITLNTAGTFMTDRWCQNNGGSAVMTGARSTDGPTGLTQSSLLITTTTGSAPSAGNLVDIFQPIEGYNIADLAYGTASAQTTTVSFWVKSSLTGTFCVAYGNASGNRSYVTTYTINSANTWEYKTVTITGDTTGTWGTTNGVGLSLFFDMGSGSNYNTTANAWASGFYTRVSGATSLSATTGATWQVTGVQFEVGTVATSFDYRPYGTELALCQRYYEVLYEPFGAGRCNASPAPRFFARFTVVKRATPTCAGTGSFSCSDMYTTDATQTANQGASIIANQTTNGCVFGFNASTLNNSTPFVTAALAYNLSNTGVITASAEL